MKLVRCNDCNWIGDEKELDILYVDDIDDEGYVAGHERCPKCFGMEALMDIDYDCYFNDEELRVLWSILEDVAMNPETEEIEEEFLGFPEGTHREDIWHWFDERYSGGVHALM